MTNPTGGYQPPSTAETPVSAGSTIEPDYAAERATYSSDPTYSSDASYAREGAYAADSGYATDTVVVTDQDAAPSTKDTAKSEAANVGQTAKEAGGQVASSAADQAKNVASETKRQAKDLIGQAHGQVKEQAGTQKDKATTGLRSLADELRSVADGNGPQNGVTSDLARQAADKAHEIAAWIEARDAGTLLDEVRSLARRKPGTFLLGAALAGVVAGRLTRGVVAANSDDTPTRTEFPSQGVYTPGHTPGTYSPGNGTPSNGHGVATTTGYSTPGAPAVTARPADPLVDEPMGAPVHDSEFDAPEFDAPEFGTPGGRP